MPETEGVKIAITRHSHRKGNDILIHLVPESYTSAGVEVAITKGLEHTHGRAAVQQEFEEYGSLQCLITLKDGQLLELILHNDEQDRDVVRQYRLRFEEVK